MKLLKLRGKSIEKGVEKDENESMKGWGSEIIENVLKIKECEHIKLIKRERKKNQNLVMHIKNYIN